MRYLCAVLLAVGLFAVAVEAQACGGYGVQQLNQGYCGQQLNLGFVQPFYAQQLVVPQVHYQQAFVQPQRVIVQRQNFGHHRQQAIIQRQVVAPRQQVIRQRTVIRNR